MKRFFVCLVFCLFSLPITAGTNTRVARVIDSRTLQLDGGTTVTLRGVDVAAEDEADAVAYLRTIVSAGSPVYVDNGNVYRSPDALFLNGQLMTRAWHSLHQERFLGWADPAGKTLRDTTPRTPAPRKIAPPKKHHYPRVRIRAAK